MKIDRRLTLGERLCCVVFPARCLCCGRAVLPERLFCDSCAGSLPEDWENRKLYLKEAPEGVLQVKACLPYDQGFRRTLHRLKFQEERALAKPIGQLMGEAARSFGLVFQAVVWVPMSDKKLRQRGYNQSELLARSVAKELNLPALAALEQVRETGFQHTKSLVQRVDNVRDAYRATHAVAGKDLLLVDDIITTGATLLSCTQSLYLAGAKSVCGLCAASTSLRIVEEESQCEKEAR